MIFNWENLRSFFEPSRTYFANKAVTSLAGGVYRPHSLTKKSIRSSLVGILLENLLAPTFYLF